MRAKSLKEGLFDDEANSAAMRSWGNREQKTLFSKTITVDPFEITLDRQNEWDSLRFILNKYRIPFEIMEPVIEGKLKFTDGVEFDTSGELRAEERHDGWYVIGGGRLIPVDSQQDAEDYINSIKNSNLNTDIHGN